MGSDGALTEEERGCPLAVRPPFRDEPRDAELGRAEAFHARPAPDPAELGPRLRGPAGRGESLELSTAAAIAWRAARFWRARLTASQRLVAACVSRGDSSPP